MSKKLSQLKCLNTTLPKYNILLLTLSNKFSTMFKHREIHSFIQDNSNNKICFTCGFSCLCFSFVISPGSYNTQLSRSLVGWFFLPPLLLVTLYRPQLFIAVHYITQKSLLHHLICEYDLHLSRVRYILNGSGDEDQNSHHPICSTTSKSCYWLFKKHDSIQLLKQNMTSSINFKYWQ